MRTLIIVVVPPKRYIRKYTMHYGIRTRNMIRQRQTGGIGKWSARLLLRANVTVN